MVRTVSSQEQCPELKSCLGCSVWHLHVLPASVWILSGMLHLPPKVQRQACQANRLALQQTSNLSTVYLSPCSITIGIAPHPCKPKLDKQNKVDG